MANCTTVMSATTEGRPGTRRPAVRPVLGTADDRSIETPANEPGELEEWDMVDFWGSSDAAWCLATWG